MLAILFDFPWQDRRKLQLWSDWAGDIALVKDEPTRKQRLAMMYGWAELPVELERYRAHPICPV